MGMTQPVRSSLVTLDPVPRRSATRKSLPHAHPTDVIYIYFDSYTVIEQLSTLLVLGILISNPKSNPTPSILLHWSTSCNRNRTYKLYSR